MINKIKNNLELNIGKEVVVILKGSRNRHEKYHGIIDKIYSNIFTIKLDNAVIKSFSYADVLIHNVEVIFN